MPSNADLDGKVALITGGARRIGATIARTLHKAGMQLLVHYRYSLDAAEALKTELHAIRNDSVLLAAGDLCDIKVPNTLIELVNSHFGRLDLLVNNASSFYATPFGDTTEVQFDELIATNLKAPYFLAQAAAGLLQESGGSIINITDFWANRPLAHYPVYSATKAGLASVTRSLAGELAPRVRVNAIAPGAILWPEKNMSTETQETIIARTPLGSAGKPNDVASAVLFLARDAKYITGEILQIDGGRSIMS